MTDNEIREKLCYYDLRNPDGISIFASKEEIDEEGYGNHRREGCSCDNCFYGRTILAEELLKFKK